MGKTDLCHNTPVLYSKEVVDLYLFIYLFIFYLTVVNYFGKENFTNDISGAGVEMV